MFRKFAYMIQKNFDSEKDITKEELQTYVKKGAIIIDVRSPQEYREGHINGAISIPDYQIKRTIQRIVDKKDETIIVYCSTGHRSQAVQQVLQNMGYTNVYNVYDGIDIYDIK